MAKVKKAQKGITATKDSTGYFKNEVKKATKNLSSKYDKPTSYSEISSASNKLAEASKNLKRQSQKGKPGYDANGFPLKKEKIGGKVRKAQAGLTVKSTKRVGPVDPKGAWTTVQKKTLAGDKTSVSLKKDKEQGATKMKMGGKMSKKK